VRHIAIFETQLIAHLKRLRKKSMHTAFTGHESFAQP